MPRSERSLKRKQKEAQEIASKCRKLTNFYGSKLKTDNKGTEEKEIGASSHPDSPQAEEIESQDINNPQQSTYTVQTQKVYFIATGLSWIFSSLLKVFQNCKAIQQRRMGKNVFMLFAIYAIKNIWTWQRNTREMEKLVLQDWKNWKNWSL